MILLYRHNRQRNVRNQGNTPITQKDEMGISPASRRICVRAQVQTNPGCISRTRPKTNFEEPLHVSAKYRIVLPDHWYIVVGFGLLRETGVGLSRVQNTNP